MSATMQIDTKAEMETREAASTNTPVVLNDKAVEEFKSSLRGSVLRPGDAGYDDARKVWNGMIDRHPALIVQCRGTADVIAAVNFARNNGFLISVRGGGHNVAGSAVYDDALVVDLSRTRSVRVDPEKSVARVEGGATLGDVDHETQAFGLALPSGTMSETGIAGLALHGGYGFLTRKYGLTADNLIAADVVTADGKLLEVDKDNHPDLLWAMRGGGSFGVVTSFEFQLHPVGPNVWIAIVMYPVAEVQQILEFYRSFMAQAPDELMALVAYWTTPRSEELPEEIRGAPVIVLAACWSGASEEGERAIQPLRQVSSPLLDLSGAMPYEVAQKLFDADYPKGDRYYWKSIYLPEISDEFIRVFSDNGARRPSPRNLVAVWSLGGAISRVKPSATAFYRRDAPWLVSIEGDSDEAALDDANIAWVRQVFHDLQRFSSSGSYLNFPGFHEEGETVLKQTFGANYERLREIKTKYDPNNLFRFNLKIPPKS
jgi:FAD/FMN-containing dehydrogenase